MLHAVLVPLSVLLFLIAPTLLLSQEFSLHPAGGYEYGALLSIQRDRGVINDGRSEGFGKSFNHLFWIGVEGEVEGVLNDLSLSARAGMAFGSGGFISRPYNDTSAIDRSTGDLTPSLNEFRIDATEVSVQAEVTISHGITRRWRLRGGPWLRYRLASDFVYTERVASPSDLVFAENNTPERVLGSGEALASPGLKFGALLGIEREIPLSETITIRPELLARCDIEALGRGLGLRAFIFGGSVTVPLDFGNESEPLPAPSDHDTTIVLTGRSKIDAMVDLFSVDTLDVKSDTAIIQTEQTLHRSFLQLPPVIFFDRNSEAIPARFLASGDTLGAGNSPLESERDPVALYRNLLNIIGRRLYDNEAWTVRLESFLAAGEPAGVARRRAEEIQNYLSETWKIQKSRVKIADGPPLCLEYMNTGHGGVQITSSNPQVIAPVLYQWVAESYAIPHIRLNRKISSALGIRDWRIVVRRAEQEIASFSSDDALSSSVDVSLSATRLGADSLLPITADLTVTDLSGARVTVGDELPLRIGLADTARPREIRTYIFLCGNSSCSTYVSTYNALIANLMETVSRDMRVTIVMERCDDQEGGDPLTKLLLSELVEHELTPSEIRMTNPHQESPEKQAYPEEELFSHTIRVMVMQND